MGAGACSGTQPLAIKEAGIVVDWEQDGACAIVRDDRPDGVKIRNRGGEAVAKMVSELPRVRILNMKDSRIFDNGLGHLSLVLRQTNQLEELYLGPCGHVGLEFAIGLVKRCTRLHTLHLQLSDEVTRQRVGKNLVPADYDTSGYVLPEKKEGEEEEEAEEEEDPNAEKPPEDEEELEAWEKAKLAKMQKLFTDNDYDSENENGRVQPGGKPPGEGNGPSTILLGLLGDFVQAVAKKENLLNVVVLGEAVPADFQLDLNRALEDHQKLAQKRALAKEDVAVRTAYDALKDQMDELNSGKGPDAGVSVDDLLSGGDGMQPTRLGMRSYVNRRVFAALGEALFECQRFKSKENESVSSAQGEMAFIAMYLRKQAAQMSEGTDKKR